MTTFGEYASFYDFFYERKDYEAEAAYVARLIHDRAPAARALLDIGCGTGRHDIRFAAAGFHVHGIDRSPEMLRQARRRLEGAAPDVRLGLRFTHADATSFDLGSRFDAAVSLFHVVSYLAEDADLAAALGCIRRHLRPGAPFIFDFWYGPAVEASPPQAVERSAVEGKRRMRRMTTPTWQPDRGTVNIKFTLRIEEEGKAPRSFEEDHLMRYYGADEIARRLAELGFDLARLTEWMSDAPCGPASFGACAVALAR